MKRKILAAALLAGTALETVEMKPDIPPDWRWRVPMRNLFFAALSVLTLSVAVVPAYAHDFHNGSTVAGDRAATRLQQTGAYGDE